MKREYQVCKRCVMDTTDSNIVFDEFGFCNHCINALNRIDNLYKNKVDNKNNLDDIISKTIKSGKKQKYDCIIGLSGGVDSSYLAYVLVKQFNIKPLAIHVDNGWNSEIANQNIDALVNNLNIDLITYKINWQEFKDLQKSFLRASVVDLEMLSDHAIVVIAKKIARKNKIKYFWIGSNYQTESVMPSSWFYSCKYDSGNIKAIHKKHGQIKKLTTYPYLSFLGFLNFHKGYGKYLSPLSYMDYNKDEAKQILEKEIGYKNYGEKHDESLITKFYQNYILPNKFNIDKRKAHLSSLICSQQITREEALKELQKPFYNSKIEEENAVKCFCEKIGLSIYDFHKIMKTPREEHVIYKSYIQKKNRYASIINRIFRK